MHCQWEEEGLYSNLSNVSTAKACQRRRMEIRTPHHCFEAEYRCERVQAQALTQGPVREAVHELQVGREGEDVEEVEEDVHSDDGPHVEEGMDPDIPHLVVFAS